MSDENEPNPANRMVYVGGLVDKTSVTLSVNGIDLDPDDVSRRLGCAPTRSHRRGDAISARGSHTRACWGLRVEGKAPIGPEELIRQLLAQLPAEEDTWRDLRRDFKVRLFIGIFTDDFNRGFGLSPGTVSLIAKMGVNLDFDIYAGP